MRRAFKVFIILRAKMCETDYVIQVDRIHVYDTVPSNWSEWDYTIASKVDAVAFGSPSAAKIWAARVGTSAHAVCIGKTTYKAAIDNGFKTAEFPTDCSSGELKSWCDLTKAVINRIRAKVPPTNNTNST